MPHKDGESHREDSSFDGVPVDRREFVRLAAASAGAVALPGAASAADAATAPRTDLYQFVVAHASDDYEIPTLVELSEPAFEKIEPHADEYFRTTTTPGPAAWLHLTPPEVETVESVAAVTKLRYSPGSNPFWRLGHYPDGVFPNTGDSVDYVDYEQMIDGMTHLAERHGDRVRLRSAGQSPGHRNLFLDEVDEKELWTVEVTNDVDDEAAFERKEKVLFTLSIHGDERSGAEAGTRFVEQVLEGEEPAIESLLDDVVLVFVYANPDGWVARNQQYFVDLDGDGDPENNSFKRQTATGVDANRQYPTVGWIDPSHYPAEPDGTDLADDRPGVDDDVPAEYEAVVPGSLDLVEFFRGYENLNIGSDLHGMFLSESLIEGLVVNDQYEHGDFHDIYEWNKRLESRLEASLGDSLEANRENFEALNDRIGSGADTLPTSVYDYGTIFDTIQYSTTGTLISWMSQPEEKGGLGMSIMAHEMGWDNRVFQRRPFLPWLTDLWVEGYQEVIRGTTEHATRDVSANIRTGGASTAYVETDALTRSSADLSFGDATRRTRTETAAVGRQFEPVTVDVSENAGSLSVTVDVSEPVLAKLRAPDGQVIATFNSRSDRRERQTPEWTVESPAAGEWTVALKAVGPAGETSATVRSTVVVGETGGSVDAPDPVGVLGYQQRPYSVSPLAYFPDYAEYVAGSGGPGNGRGSGGGRGRGRGRGNPGNSGNATESMVGLSVGAIEDGALFRGNSHRLAVENLVLTHDEGSGDSEYVDQLDAFVAAGGNLVLTDRGVSLLGAMDNDLAADVAPADVSEIGIYLPFVGDRNEDHPLLAGTRPIQRELWKVAPLGYAITFPGSAPLTVVDADSFESAGGTVAGYTRGDVSAGSLAREDGTGIHVIGGLLPSASQSNLHPFGLLEYTATFLGHTMLTNALGYQQRRYVDGELVATFGEVRE